MRGTGTKPRAGVSLIELLVCISLMVTILALTGKTFHLLFRADKSVTQSFVTERAITRLSIQFRNDVHQAATGTIPVDSTSAGKELLLIDSGAGRVKYVVTKEGLARLVVDGETVTAREDYRLPDCEVRFASGGEADSTWRTLIIERPGSVITKNIVTVNPVRAITVQASLNRFRPPTSNSGPSAVSGGPNAIPPVKEELP